MTAHIVTPYLSPKGSNPDSKLSQIPASLNPDAIAILREDFEYDGLIVSDCLEMDGVRAKYGTATSAVFAIQVTLLFESKDLY